MDANVERAPPPVEEQGRLVLPAGVVEFTPTSDDPLIEMLRHTWLTICEVHDIAAEMPNITALFSGARLRRPYDAAESVLANMLLEVVERVDRFSPWYGKSAAAYGLVAGEGLPLRWRLTEQGCARWWGTLDNLATVIEAHHGLLRALILVDEIMLDGESAEECFLAVCGCEPPRIIQVPRALLQRVEILCDSCRKPFRLS